MEWDGHGGEQEIQRIMMMGTASAGTFRLSFDGATTTVIPFDATGDQVCVCLF